MEQIVVTKPNGTTYPLAIRHAATQIKTAKQTMALLGDDVVDLNVESPFPEAYGIGDKITVFGRVYKLNQLPKVKKTGVREFSYDIQFEGVQYDLLCATYDLTIDTTTNELQDVQADSLTGDLRRFATVLITNANRVFPGQWVLGTCPDTKTITLTFSETDNCLSVLQNLCSESNFNIEFEIAQNAGVNTVNFKKVGQIFPYTFQFGRGKGLYSLDRQNVSSSSIVTRLKVQGSSGNITSKYRAQRLCLPGKTKAQSYIEKADAVAKYGIIEGKKFFDDIKPTFNGSITGLVSGSVLKFIDTKMFDLNALEADGKTTKYLIEGCAAKVHFNTGNLAGYEFEVHAYDHATKTFTLVKQTDDRGDVFPSESSLAFQFAVGNEYKLLDVALPDTYEQAAESELANEGNTYYDQNSQPKVQYGLSITKSFLEKMVDNGTTVNIFAPGDYIHVKDSDIDVDKSVRIKSLTRNLLDEYEYTLTISDTVSTNITNRVISELIDIDKVININNLKDTARARANWRSSRELLNMVFDPDGDYYTDKIKPNSIETLALSVGAKSMQFGLTNTVFQPNHNGNKNLIKVQGGVLTHYTINEESARSWILADNITTLTTDSQAYYIYAKCQRVGTAGSIIFSASQIKTEHDASFYHFWIGVLNSVDTELQARSVALSYGFTMVNGRFIKTGRIESADGTTYFDLDNSEIGGTIKFLPGSTGYDNIADRPKYITDALHDSTIIDGGVILSSLLNLGYTENDVFKSMAGINGIYNAQKRGGGISAWYGGSMVDAFDYYDFTNTVFLPTLPANAAKGVDRMDGTGYRANGNLWWDDKGKVHADPLSFFVGEDYIGNNLALFQLHYLVEGNKDFSNINYVVPQKPFSSLDVLTELKIGDVKLAWDVTNNAVKILKSDGTAANLIVSGGLALHSGTPLTADNFAGLPIDGTTLYWDNGVLKSAGSGAGLSSVRVNLGSVGYDSVDGIVNLPAYPTTLPASDVYAWAKAANKPAYAYSEISGTPTSLPANGGNADFAGLLTSVSGTTSTKSVWNPQNLQYQAWGQAFLNTSIVNNDTGDLVLWLRRSEYVSGQAELCMMIDGDYYAGTGKYKVWHNGNSGTASFDWTCKNLTTAGAITGASLLSFSDGNDGRKFSIDNYGGLLFKVATGGWANGYIIEKLDGTSWTAYGSFGNGSTINYAFMGGSWDNPTFVVKPNGNVAIGTDTPQSNLHINGRLLITPYSGHGLQSNYDEGIRVASPADKWSGIFIGTSGLGDGVQQNQWCFAKNPIGILQIAPAGQLSGDNYANKGLSISADGSIVHIAGNLSVSLQVSCRNTVHTQGAAFYTSDMRKKTVIDHIDLSLLQIANAPAIRFAWKESKRIGVGGSAQYAESLIPELVMDTADGKVMDYATTAYLFSVNVAKELYKFESDTDRRIRELETEVEQLKSKRNGNL